jgi:Holliday junction resolvase-like predicted endonuclease
MLINQKFNFVEGPFNTETGEIICVRKDKYGEVTLCFRENMYIPFARIKLHSDNTFGSAMETIDDAYNLGQEICRRWNAFKSDSLKHKNINAQK